MVTVTYTASEHMAYMLSDLEVRDDVVLRIELTTDGVKMQPDTMRPGDETVDHNGQVILVLDQQTLKLLGDKTLDLLTDDDGSRLIISVD
jgi:Fe-S cluster assembly iron-binding protein IscA